MKKYLLGLLFPLLLLTTAFQGPFQGDADLVVAALKSGNPAEIAKHFAVVVDVKFLTAPEDKIVATEKAAKAITKKVATASKPAPKPAPAEIDVASLDVPGLVAAGKLSSLTIPQMKAYCRSMKQPVGGKKADLEARIKTHLGISTEQ